MRQNLFKKQMHFAIEKNIWHLFANNAQQKILNLYLKRLDVQYTNYWITNVLIKFVLSTVFHKARHLAHTSAESTERRRVTEERLPVVVTLMKRDCQSRHSRQLTPKAASHSLYRDKRDNDYHRLSFGQDSSSGKHLAASIILLD